MYKHFVKRLFDIIIGIIGFPFFLIALIVFGPIIKLTDNGPVFYSAERIGKNGKLFKMFKFRSMKVNAPDVRNDDGTTFNSSSDPRVTAIGLFLRKTSLDEIPQILNLLKGDMSLIGPRPDLPDAEERYYDDEIRKKLLVRPGMTGLNQAYYRNTANLKTRFDNDVYYAENVSFKLDIKIFFKTISTVLKREGVFKN